MSWSWRSPGDHEVGTGLEGGKQQQWLSPSTLGKREALRAGGYRRWGLRVASMIAALGAAVILSGGCLCFPR